MTRGAFHFPLPGYQSANRTPKLPSSKLYLCFVFFISSAKNIFQSLIDCILVFHEGLTCFTSRADAEKRCDPVDACGALAARSRGAVINVLRAVGPTPAVNAHADIAANQVGAGASVLASVWL